MHFVASLLEGQRVKLFWFLNLHLLLLNNHLPFLSDLLVQYKVRVLFDCSQKLYLSITWRRSESCLNYIVAVLVLNKICQLLTVYQLGDIVCFNRFWGKLKTSFNDVWWILLRAKFVQLWVEWLENFFANVKWPIANHIGDCVVAILVWNCSDHLLSDLIKDSSLMLRICLGNQVLHYTETILVET